MALGLGCNGGGCDGDGTGSGGGPIPLDQLGAEYAQAICRKVFTCCDVAEYAAAFTDEASCRAGFATQFNDDVSNAQTDIAAGRLAYHGDRARGCLDALAALPCARWGGNQELTGIPECLQAFEPLVAPGDACVRDAACVAGYCQAGICTADVGLGESCAVGSCRPELSCIYDASGKPTVCAQPLSDGAACTFGSECTSQFCVTNAAGAHVCGASTFCNGV
jgi:hypothetical protein